MDFVYIVIKVGNSFASIKIKDDFDLQNESENIITHVKNGNSVLICDDLETAAELFGTNIDTIIDCEEEEF